jgi:two-component system response regulator WspF
MNTTVGIVNDLRLAATVLERIVNATPGFSVAWVAMDGESAVTKHAALPAEIVLMDLILPGMDGAETTAALMKIQACAILVVTATVIDNRGLVFAAMGKGALDAVNTPMGPDDEAAAELRRKLLTVNRLVHDSRTRHGHRHSEAYVSPAQNQTTPATGHALNLIAIGASTGGPQALATVLRALPCKLDAAVVVVQHLDKQFVPGLQRWLGQESRMPVSLAENGDTLKAGAIWLAHTDQNLVVAQSSTGNLNLQYVQADQDALHRPSVDIFFKSLIRLRSTRLCALLLTGMGSDGAEGLLSIRRAGGMTFAQDEASSTVFGMPRAAVELGAVDATTNLLTIPEALIAFAGTQSNRGRHTAETRLKLDGTIAR